MSGPLWSFLSLSCSLTLIFMHLYIENAHVLRSLSNDSNAADLVASASVAVVSVINDSSITREKRRSTVIEPCLLFSDIYMLF